MLVSDVCLEEREGYTVLSAAVVREWDKLSRRVEYKFHGCPPDLISTRGDAFVAGLLLPAMRAGEDLMIQAPVSPLLMGRVAEITRILAGWRPRLQRIEVRAPVSEPERRGSAVGLFFSGGVDSYYSLLKNMEEQPDGESAITHLVFAYGIDTRYGYDQAYLDSVSPMVHKVAQETGKRAIILECNLRKEMSETGWMIYHGSALISTGLALTPLLRRCLIASSRPHARLIPWGSHPQLDPLWSTETLEIVYDGSEAERSEKIASRIARSDLALSTLRVCFEAGDQPKNCGRCGKCLQTMIALHAAGALESCSTFMAPLDVKRVRTIGVPGRRHALDRLLEELGESRFDRRLARAIKFALWRDDLKQAVGRGLQFLAPPSMRRNHRRAV